MEAWNLFLQPYGMQATSTLSPHSQNSHHTCSIANSSATASTSSTIASASALLSGSVPGCCLYCLRILLMPLMWTDTASSFSADTIAYTAADCIAKISRPGNTKVRHKYDTWDITNLQKSEWLQDIQLVVCHCKEVQLIQQAMVL